MKHISRATSLLLLAAVASCGDLATAPAVDAPQVEAQPTALIGTLLSSPVSATALRRTTPLPQTYTVSKTIGLFGGSLSIPAAGVTLVVPLGAVTRNTTITMTAHAGSAVAYSFSPHGTKFLVPPLITQKMSGIQYTWGTPIYAAYFEDLSDIDLATGVGTVTEILNVATSPLLGTATFAIGHFSGYMVAGGTTREMKMGVEENQ